MKKYRKVELDDNGYLTVLYFAYGSNLNIEQMKARCPGSKPVAVAVVPNYRLTFKGSHRRGYGVADIEQAKTGGYQVFGALYRITAEDLITLDRYEGYPRMYDRYYIPVVLEDGTEVLAFAYQMAPHYVEAAPGEHYFEIIRQGYEDWGIDTASLYEAQDWVGESGKRLEYEF
ncbi:histone acetyltransferase HPA2 and related acetyltransferases [Pelotomaculum thermopropionicum SI]|uniref:Histone acetyltransferase HPA2 and related acetyltransferases n=1 Tax=Pelotomaculum thermopropionicum (strain DSM 13744 / JCM 10971 / SI) TaxID=370438 RepID=A5D070_PELTS|nr:histone acetyltransferase HPA2 and related acetyltransferases [Pelotomaculum thermopropionicum SI]